MATYEDPAILNVGREYIQTDKGPLWYTVVDIDCEINLDDVIKISANRHRITVGNTVFASMHGNTPNDLAHVSKFLTVGETSDQSVKVIGSLSNNNEQVDGTIRIYGNMAFSTGAWSGSYTQPFAWWACLMGCFYRGTNGAMFAPMTGISVGRWNGGSEVNYNYLYYNAPNSYGNYSGNELNSAVNITVSQAYLTGAEPFMHGRKYGDPYEDGGYTDPEGEIGSPEPDEVPNQTPDDLPSQFSDLSAGLYRLYAMDDSELSSFSQQLWKPSVLSSLKNYLERPTDIVMGLRSYPFEVNAGAGVNIGFNWVNDWVSSGVVGHPISGTGIQQVIFGTLKVPRPSDVFYDYQPFSSAMLHLPYIGFVPMKMNEIVGKTLYIRYSVDLASGDFTAWVTMGASDEIEPYYNLKVYGYYQGNISKPLPLTQQDMWQLYKKGAEIALNAAGAIGTLATGSLMKATGEYLADMPLTGKGAVLRYESGSEMASAGSAMIGDYKRKGTQAVNSALEMSYVSSPIERNGYLDGSTGRTSSQECFLIITYPDQCVPENQSILGYPTNIPGPLSKVSGYTEVKEIRLASGIASEYELAELEGIVKGGIII